MKALRKIFITAFSSLLALAMGIGIACFAVSEVKLSRLKKVSMADSPTAKYAAYLPDEETIFSYAEDLSNMGARRPGTEIGRAAQNYVKEKFAEFGLEDIRIIPSKTTLYTCDEYSLSVEGQTLESFYINYSGTNGTYGKFSTGENGLTAELVYVGDDTDSKVDVKGKIVVADCGFQSIPYFLGKIIGELYYDPDNTFGIAGTKDVVYMGDSFTESYFNYTKKGAAGYIGILTDYYDSADYHSEDYSYLGDMSAPGFWVSKSTGKELVKKIKNSKTPVKATMTMNCSLKEVEAGAVVGYKKGKSDETIMVQCHYDSITKEGAVEDASGMSCLLALAKMYSRIPAEDMEKTVLFIATDTHFSDYDTQDAVVEALFGKDSNIVANICVEHIAKEYEITDDLSISETGLIDPRIVFVSGSKKLVQIVNEEFVRHDMKRTLVLPATLLGENLCTDADEFYQEGIPVCNLISSPVYLYDDDDTLDKIQKDALVPTCETVSDILWRFMQADSASLKGESTEKVSKPFSYSGYSKAEYKSYAKSSEYVEMSDGTKIAVDIYLPSDGPEASNGYPVVFQYTPYGRAFTIPKKMGLIEKLKMRFGTGTSDNTLDRANSHDTVYGSSDTIVRTLLSYGYAYVCADIRGTGASYGVKIDFMPEIANDGKELIDWISKQAWSDGTVGMFGGSYLGYSQLVVAGKKPEALKAIFPEVVAMDGFSTEIRPGGVFCQLYSSEDFQTLYEMNNYLPDEYVYPTAPVVDEDGDGELWDEIPLDLNANGTFLDDYTYPENPNDEPLYADGNKRKHIYYLATVEHKNNVPYNTLGPLAKTIDTKVTLGSGTHSLGLTAYDASPAAAVPDIMESDIAVYNHGSWMDPFVTSTTELYSTMKETNASKMIIDVGYHETYSPFWKANNEDEDAAIKAYAIELVRFYDRYLKGIKNGIDTEPPVYIYNMNGDGWRFENEWPLARQKETDYFFSSNGELVKEETAVESGADDYAVDLSQKSSWAADGYDYDVSRYVMAAPDNLPDRTEEDEKCLTYVTNALASDTEVTGYPIITFYASSTSDSADFHIYMEDVDAEDRAVLVTEAVINAGFAETYDNDTMLSGGKRGVDVLPNLPWHGYETSQYNARPFANGEIVKYTVNLFPTSYVFKKGHSIRIAIACANTPTFATNSALDENTVVTMHRDTEHPSKITLPIIAK